MNRIILKEIRALWVAYIGDFCCSDFLFEAAYYNVDPGLWARHKLLYLREFLELGDNFWCSEKLSSWNVQKWCFQRQKNKTSYFQIYKQKICVFWEKNGWLQFENAEKNYMDFSEQ